MSKHKHVPKDRLNIAADMRYYDSVARELIENALGPTKEEELSAPFCSALCGNHDCMKNSVNMQYPLEDHKLVNMKHGLYCRGFIEEFADA